MHTHTRTYTCTDTDAHTCVCIYTVHIHVHMYTPIDISIRQSVSINDGCYLQSQPIIARLMAGSMLTYSNLISTNEGTETQVGLEPGGIPGSQAGQAGHVEISWIFP